MTWKLTKKEQFDLIKTLLEDLKARDCFAENGPEYFIIDTCCTWRNKLQETFGKCTKVLLDLFHATQRITRTIVKTHPFQRSCVHDCSLVFRKSDDQSNERKMETAPKEIILKNLDEFSRKWKHISETSSDGPLLRETFDVQVKNLRKHVALGCLSGIPPSFSTSINESLHQKINDLYAGVKMGPELAFALLTVFFHAWNSRRKNVIKGVPVIQPLSLQTRTNCESTHQNECFGIGGKKSNDTLCSNINDLAQSEEQSNATFGRAMSMLNFLNIIKQLSNNGSGLHADDLFFHNEILKYVLKGGKRETSTFGSDIPDKSQLEGTAAQFGMEIVPISPDGNCLFTAIAFSIAQNITNSDNTSKFYCGLGIQACDTVEEMSKTLRQETTNELKRNKAKYLPFLTNLDGKQYDDLVTDFQRPGVFAGDMGDVIVKSLANALKTPLVILTNISNYKVITVTPDEFHDGNGSIFVTYTRDGPGHYDALVRKDCETTDKPNNSAGKLDGGIKCTCGASRSQSKPSCADQKNDTGRKYASRCPCLRKNKACTKLCKCNGCNNPNGAKMCEGKTECNYKRQRADSDLKGERLDGSSYLVSKNEHVTHGKWTDEENFVFLQHIDMYLNVLVEYNSHTSMTVAEFTKKFNSTLTQMGVVKSGRGQLKTETQIKNKIKNVKKKKELLYRLVEDDIQMSINTVKQNVSNE